MAERKHRIVLEVTFNKALSEEKAVKAFKLALDNAGFLVQCDLNPIWCNGSDVHVQKVQVKSFSRVVRGLLIGAANFVKKACGV